MRYILSSRVGRQRKDAPAYSGETMQPMVIDRAREVPSGKRVDRLPAKGVFLTGSLGDYPVRLRSRSRPAPYEFVVIPDEPLPRSIRASSLRKGTSRSGRTSRTKTGMPGQGAINAAAFAELTT